MVEITPSFKSITRQFVLRDLDERLFSREDVMWNWCYYHQLIVIIAHTVKGILYGSVRVSRVLSAE